VQPRASVLGSLAVLLLTVPAATNTQTPSESRYIQILERYQKGDDDAIPILASLDAKALEAGERAIVKAFEEAPSPASRGTRLLRAAVVAHTDAAIFGRSGPTVIPWSPHLAAAERYAERLASRNQKDPVATRWWVIAIGAMHAQRNYGQAMTVANRARRMCGDRPEFLLAAGVTNELAWTWEHEQGFPSPFGGSLQDAEKLYAQLLAMDPASIEARVRLARVRTLRGETGSAVRTLGEIPDSAPPVLLFLARLFEGDALERQGNIADARKRYESAIRLLPQGQSAQVALAFTQYQDGARAEAASRVRDTTADRYAADDGDPWFRYSMGFGFVARPELTALRALVRQ